MLVLRQTVPDMRDLNQLLLKQWQLNHHSPVLQLLVSIFFSTILKYFSPPYRRFERSTTVYSILQIIWTAGIYKADAMLSIWCLSTFCRCFIISMLHLFFSIYLVTYIVWKIKNFWLPFFPFLLFIFNLWRIFFDKFKKMLLIFYFMLRLHRFSPHLTVYSFIYLGRLYASLHINE